MEICKSCAVKGADCVPCIIQTGMNTPSNYRPAQRSDENMSKVNTTLFAKDVLRTWNHNLSKDDDIKMLLAAMGLTNEAGEAGDVIKKHVEQGQPLDREKLINELGDVYYYFTLTTVLHNITLDEIVAANVEKRQKRYPTGFSTADSIARVDTKSGE